MRYFLVLIFSLFVSSLHATEPSNLRAYDVLQEYEKSWSCDKSNGSKIVLAGTTCLLKTSYIDRMNRICIYRCPEEVIVEMNGIQLCPLQIEK